MGFIKIRCGQCSRMWEVYPRDIKAETANICPHCGAEIDLQTWEKQIMPAWGALDDANRELIKDATGYNMPLFSVNYIWMKDKS